MKLPFSLELLFARLARFSGIGVINTLIHTGIVVLLVERLAWHPSLANALAFGVANVFSYQANRRWNFKGDATLRQYGRFLLVSLLGLCTTVVVSGLAEWAGFHYLVGLLMVFVALPLLTFTLHWRWTFRNRP